MGQAVADLPDPLESPKPGEGPSADDLLAKMAGDEIDRLLAESENGAGAAPLAPTPSAPSVSAPPATDQPAAETPADAAVNLDEVLNNAEADAAALRHPTLPPISDAGQIDLGDTVERKRGLPLIFRPLVWINAPLDPWPDRLRDVLGKIAIMTLVNAVAVLAYVLLFRHHH